MKKFFDFLLPERTHLKAVIAALIAIFLLSGVLAYQVHRSAKQRVEMEAVQKHSYELTVVHSMSAMFESRMNNAINGVFKRGMLTKLGASTHADIRNGISLAELCARCPEAGEAGPVYEIDFRSSAPTIELPIPPQVVSAVRSARSHELVKDTFETGAISIPTSTGFDAYAFLRDIRPGQEAAWIFKLPRRFIAFADAMTIAENRAVPMELMHQHKLADLFHVEVRAHGDRLATTSLSPATESEVTSASDTILPELKWSATMLPLGHQILFPIQDDFLSPGWLLAVMAAIGSVILMAIVLVRREEELYRLRSDLISGVSHELRTPLAQIRMFAETLLLGRTRTEAERRRSLEIIDQEAKRLSHFVDNMLQFAKGEGGRAKLAPEPTSFAVEVRRAVESFAPMCQARGVEVRTELEDGVTAAVDRAALRRIMLNLMENALKYGPDEQRISVGGALFGDVVRLWVDDEGEGIPRGDRERVFDSFYRLSRELDRRITGSGIGLAVVRQLATLHNGRSWAEEAPGGGARLVVEFPDAYVRPIEEGTGWAVA